MKLEGTIRIDIEEMKRALAEYVGRAYGLEIKEDSVHLYHVDGRYCQPTYGARVTVDDHVLVAGKRI